MILVHRWRNNISQKEAAIRAGMSLKSYRELELYSVDNINLNLLSNVESCKILRKRNKLTQQELANKIGISRIYVNMMENNEANPNRLIKYWKENGYESAFNTA